MEQDGSAMLLLALAHTPQLIPVMLLKRADPNLAVSFAMRVAILDHKMTLHLVVEPCEQSFRANRMSL